MEKNAILTGGTSAIIIQNCLELHQLKNCEFLWFFPVFLRFYLSELWDELPDATNRKGEILSSSENYHYNTYLVWPISVALKPEQQRIGLHQIMLRNKSNTGIA